MAGGESKNKKPFSGTAVAGFVLGLFAMLLYTIGILPIAALVVSIAALVKFDAEKQRGRWMAVVGLVLGVLYTIMYLVAYGHLAHLGITPPK